MNHREIISFEKCQKDSNDELSDISSSAESSDNDSILDIALLKPYDHEPRRTSFDEGSLSDDNSTCSTESETLRIGNTDWGLCRRCTPMESCTETLCCKETNEIAEEYFEGED